MARPLIPPLPKGVPGARASRFARTRNALGGAGFAAFVLAAVVLWKACLLAFLLLPADRGPLGAFVEQFRIWCFGFDPRTGRIEWGYVATMLLEPLLLGGVVLAVWWQPLRDAVRQAPGALLRPAGTALALVLAAAGFLYALNRPPATGANPPFPARALRTAYPAPRIALTDQSGRRFDLAELRGKVVLLTAAYTSCVHTCPAILQVARRVARSVDPAAASDLRVVAVTLDPATDSVTTLAAFSRTHGMPWPRFRFLTGPPSAVAQVLDSMEVARSRDPRTGVISHANVFLLIDRQGRVAYRFGLSPTQQRWMAEAVALLLAEPPPASATAARWRRARSVLRS